MLSSSMTLYLCPAPLKDVKAHLCLQCCPCCCLLLLDGQLQGVERPAGQCQISAHHVSACMYGNTWHRLHIMFSWTARCCVASTAAVLLHAICHCIRQYRAPGMLTCAPYLVATASSCFSMSCFWRCWSANAACSSHQALHCCI